jgi:hypothetical protein
MKLVGHKTSTPEGIWQDNMKLPKRNQGKRENAGITTLKTHGRLVST